MLAKRTLFSLLFLFTFSPLVLFSSAASPVISSANTPSIPLKNSQKIKFSAAEKSYLQSKKNITMCIDPDWMPLEKIEKGVHVGMTADYFSLFQAKVPIPIVLVPTKNWSESVQFAKSRKCDIFSLAMATKDRLTYLDFTTPYLNIPLVMAARNDMPFRDDITTLTASKLGVVKGYVFGEILRKRFPEMNIVDVSSVDKGLQMVVNQELDGFIGALATVGYSIQKNFATEMKVAGKFDERWQLGIATRNDEPLLHDIFEKVIATVTRNEHQAILNRWIAVKYVKGVDYTVIWITMAVIALVLVLLLWRFTLLRKYNIKLIEQNKLTQEAEQRYREIFNTPSDAIFIHDADTGKILDVNHGMLEMYGYTYKEAVNLDLDLFRHSDPPFSNKEAAEKVRAAVLHAPQTFEWLCRRKDASPFWGEVSLKTTEFGGKHYVVAVVRDISERKQAAIDMAAEKERLAVTLRSIGDGVITTDLSGKIILINKVAEELTGWTSHEAEGRPIDDVFHIINEKTREICKNPVTKVISSGQIIELANHTVLVARDGTERGIADSGAPIMDSESNVVGVVLVFRDVTEQIKTEEELRKVMKLESVGVLAGGIAHDFNNILAAILGNINLALFAKELPEKIKKLLLEAEKASLRAKDLTQQLLTFAKGGAPVRETASLDDVIRDSASFVLHGGQVVCKFDLPDNLLLVDIDKGQISQVIQNIVLNSCHAMPGGGVVSISCENVSGSELPDSVPQNDMFVKISIADKGIGMTADIVENIFDPYFSTKQEGSGLGLAISHSIILKHNGYIFVESALGVGSSFTIYLPASGQEKIKNEKEMKPQKSSSGLKILLMDDDEMVGSVAKAMLSQLGHNVEISVNGAEAIKFYGDAIENNCSFDLVIVDLTVPGGMGGQEAAQGILAINSGAKIIVSSGYSNDPVMAGFADFGFRAALVKPFKLQDLALVIDEITG